MEPAQPRILILHDYFLYRGGGERLVISLAKHLKADVATAFIAKDAFDPREHGLAVYEFYRERGFTTVPGFRYLQVQLSFLLKTKFIKEYDVLIYSGDCLAGVLRAKGKRNIAYMHTPPRHLYDCYKERLRAYSWWKKLIFIPFAAFNRWRFETLARRLDLIVTNSKNVQERIKQYLKLDSVVVYPPCDTLPFKNLGQGDPEKTAEGQSSGQSYFFSWARLYDVKRVHLIVEAFTKMPDKKLVVASGGPELEHIQELAKGHPNIQVLGWISDEDLLRYVGNCLATIYIPIREDFGMSPVESMTAGKPVIGVAEGGMLEVIEDGKNGVMVESDFTVADLITAVRAMTPEKAKAMEAACYETAKKFTEARFVKEMKKIVGAY